MKKLTKTISVILSALMVLGSLCIFSTSAAETDNASIAARILDSMDGYETVGSSYTKTIDGVTYVLSHIEDLDDEFVYLSRVYGYTTKLYIPSYIDGYYVVGIGERVIYLDDYLESVTLEDGIIYIERNNFVSCPKLKTINLPDSILSINTYFNDTLHYKNKANWKDGVYYINNHAVDGDYYVSSIKIREGTVSIANNFIRQNWNLTSLSLPGSLESIGATAFFDCPKLKSVTLPGSLIIIGAYAFGWKNRDDDYGVDTVPNFTIYGAKGSLAEEYAQIYGFNFKTATVPVATPILMQTQNVNSGIKITWHPVFGATKYRVFRKSGNTWKSIGDTTSTSFTDTNVKSGSSYTYTVRCLSSDGKSYISSFDSKGIAGKFIAPPTLKSTEGVNNGIKITWNAVTGATKYRVFYKSGGTWKSLGDTTDTSLTHTNVKSGSSYTYTVRCLAPDGKSYISGFDSKGITGTFVTAPSITKSENTNDGIKLTWSACKGAAKYRVYYKGSSGWTKLGETTGTSITDKNVKSGSTYTYTIRCLDSKGKFISGFNSTGWKQTYIGTPKLSKTETGANGINLSWGNVAGATKYRVFYKSGGTWKSLGETTATNFSHTSVVSGSSYTYTVRCLASDGKSYISGFDSKGITGTFVTAPSITKLENTNDGIKLTWSACKGAAKYRVYYKGSSGWTNLGETMGTSITDKNVKSGNTYTYTIRCLDSKGKLISGFNTTGWKQTYIGTPKLSKAENTANGIKLSWGKVAGATKYRVFYKSGGTWKSLGDTTDTNFTHANVKSGSSYTYTVRCLAPDGKSYVSGFDSKGITKKYIN